MSDLDIQLSEEISYYYDKPYEFVMMAFPWGEVGPLQGFDGPDQWQKDFLIDLG